MVSATIRSKGIPAQLLDLIIHDPGIDLILSKGIFDELKDVLSRDKFKLTKKRSGHDNQKDEENLH